MRCLIRRNVLVLLMMSLALTGYAAPWTGGRGAGYCGTFPQITFPRNPAMVWQSYLGAGYANLPLSNTLLAGEVVITAFDRYVVAVSAKNGQPLWQIVLDDKPVGDLLYLNNRLIISLPNGAIQTFNPINGQLAWKYRLVAGIRNAPILSDDTLIYTTKANVIEGVDLNTGQRVFKRDVPAKIEAGPALLGESLVLTYADGQAVRIDDGGIIRWRAPLANASITMNPVTDGRLVVANANSGLFCLNPGDSDKAVLWPYSCTDRLQESALLDNGRLYMATKNSALLCIDLKTGKDLWTRTVITNDRGRDIRSFKPGLQLPAKPVAQPIIFNNELLVRMESGLIALYRKDSGQLVWVYRMKTLLDQDEEGKISYVSTPAIAGDRLFFATSDGHICHMATGAPDIDPPTFSDVMPEVTPVGFVDNAMLTMLGARVEDEGVGMAPNAVFMKLDNADITSAMQYDVKSGYYYLPINPAMPLSPGMHRLVMSARDYRGNVGTLTRNFILSAAGDTEHLVIKIGGEYLPKTLQVRPGTIVRWENVAGGPRTVVADNANYLQTARFTSDILYPDGIPNGESWVWIVPQDLEFGTVIYYHCRLNGKAGDDKAVGSGLAGAIEIAEPTAAPPPPAGGAAPPPRGGFPPRGNPPPPANNNDDLL